MLFDLRGRRKRAVQGIYLVMAVLMGAGLVLFGIGGSVSGGLFDAFRDSGGGGGGNEVVEKRIESQEKKLAANSRSPVLLRDLVRDYYQLAATRIPEGTSAFPEDARGDLRKASAYWQRYIDVVDGKPDASLAGVAAQLYAQEALNQPRDAQEAYRILAEANDDTNSYLQLVFASSVAGDTRTADLAGLKAIDLAPKDQRRAVAKQVEEVKKQGSAQSGGLQDVRPVRPQESAK
jgi:tetratricopeptide (TPR) repeat protein